MTSWGWTMMVVWAAIGVGFAAWVAAAWARSASRGPAPAKTARELLDERLARGEVDPDA